MRARLGAVALGAGAIALGSCGGEPTFTADEFADELNERGAGIELGEPLASGDGTTEIRAIEVEPAGGHDAEAAGPEGGEAEHIHGGGSLYVLADEQEALARYQNCEQTDLICFRAANVALIFEGGTEPATLERIEAAVVTLGAEDER